MMTPEAAIVAALNERAEELPLFVGSPEIVYREKPGDLPDEYVMIDHLPNLSVRPMVDRTTQTLTGIYQLTLARRAGEFEIVYREQAARIAAHFIALPRPSCGSVEVTIDKIDIGQGQADGTRWIIPISVNYRLEA